MKLLDFIIGSSFPVVVLFYLGVRMNKEKTYLYEDYTLIAPIYLGLVNMLGRHFFGNSLRSSVVTGVLSGLTVALFANTVKSYDYSTEQWLEYSFYIVLKHVFIFAVLIRTLYNFI